MNSMQPQNPAPMEPKAADELRLRLQHERALDDQNLTMAIIFGSVAALLGAILWSLITVVTGRQIGFMAIGVGFLVGWAVQKTGNGVTNTFGIAGAILSLLGCMLGNLLAGCVLAAEHFGVSFSEFMSRMNTTVAVEFFKQTTGPIDLLFYGLAIYFGYKYSFRKLEGPKS